MLRLLMVLAVAGSSLAIEDVRVTSALKITEVALQDKDGCMKRALCVMGTLPEEKLPRLSIAYGAENFLHILKEMVSRAELTQLTRHDLPNMRQLLASNAVGKSAGDLSICESLFPCGVPVEDLREEAMIARRPFGNKGIFQTIFPSSTPEASVEGRTTCQTTGTLCPGITVGCALCGAFAPGYCGDTCIIAGLYCGTSGYACQWEAYMNSQNDE